jgi:hypothetical protein
VASCAEWCSQSNAAVLISTLPAGANEVDFL